MKVVTFPRWTTWTTPATVLSVALSISRTEAHQKPVAQVVMPIMNRVVTKSKQVPKCPSLVQSHLKALSEHLQIYLDGDLGQQLISGDSKALSNGTGGRELFVRAADNEYKAAVYLETPDSTYTAQVHQAPGAPTFVTAEETKRKRKTSTNSMLWTPATGFELVQQTISLATGYEPNFYAGWHQFAKGTPLETILDAVCWFCGREFSNPQSRQEVLSKLNTLQKIDGAKWVKLENNPMQPGQLKLLGGIRGHFVQGRTKQNSSSLDYIVINNDNKQSTPVQYIIRFPHGSKREMIVDVKTVTGSSLQSSSHSISYPYWDGKLVKREKSVIGEQSIRAFPQKPGFDLSGF